MSKQNPTWRRISLGEVVSVITDYWDRNPSHPERFIAGEHIDEGNLQVRRWGLTDDELVPPTFNRRFKARDVLFHSRNLRKLAAPDFDGITGEKLFIIRTIDDNVLLQNFLPFLLQTASFAEHVERTWAGSTNKFLNKTPLLKYEFWLPPPDEQRRVIELAQASTDLQEALSDAISANAKLADSFCQNVANSIPEQQQVQVGTVAKFSSGKLMAVSSLPQQPLDGANVPVYGGNGVAGFTNEPLVKSSTIVVGRVGQFCGVTTLTSGPAWITDNALYPVSISECLDIAFLALVLRGRNLNKGKLGEYLPLITQGVVHSTLVPLLSLKRQRQAVEALSVIEGSASALRKRLQQATALHQNLLLSLDGKERASNVVH